MKPKHNRKLVLGGADYVGTDLKHSFQAWNAFDNDIESLMIDSGYLENAPFNFAGVLFRYDLTNASKPQYKWMKKYNALDLPVALDMRVLTYADQTNFNLLKEIFEIATLDCLIHAGKKYKLKTQALEARRAKLGNIPSWEDIKNKPNIKDIKMTDTYYHHIKEYGDKAIT